MSFYVCRSIRSLFNNVFFGLSSRWVIAPCTHHFLKQFVLFFLCQFFLWSDDRCCFLFCSHFLVEVVGEPAFVTRRSAIEWRKFNTVFIEIVKSIMRDVWCLRRQSYDFSGKYCAVLALNLRKAGEQHKERTDNRAMTLFLTDGCLVHAVAMQITSPTNIIIMCSIRDREVSYLARHRSQCCVYPQCKADGHWPQYGGLCVYFSRTQWPCRRLAVFCCT